MSSKATIAAAAAVVLVGCESIDRTEMVDFYPDGDQFRFEAIASSSESNVGYPLNEDGEKTRMAWLEHYLEMNEMCPDSYDINDRLVVQTADSALGSAYRVEYQGHCT